MTSQIVLQIEKGELKSAAKLVEAVNGSIIETRSHGKPIRNDVPKKEFDPVTAILIGGGALAIAKFIAGWWEKRKGGVVVNLRGTEPEIRRSEDVPYGWLLILPCDDGAVRLEVRDEPKDWTERILEKIIDGTLGTVKEIAAHAKQTLKADKVTDEKGTPLD